MVTDGWSSQLGGHISGSSDGGNKTPVREAGTELPFQRASWGEPASRLAGDQLGRI